MIPEPFEEIDWSQPNWLQKKQAFLEGFERTRLQLLKKLDEVASFVAKDSIGYENTRALLVSRAYADVWGIPGQCALLNGFVLKDPADERGWEKAMRLDGPNVHWAVDLGDTLLLDTGAVAISDFFGSLNQTLEKDLAEVRSLHPAAEIQMVKGRAYIGVNGSQHWNHAAIADYLRSLLEQPTSSALLH